MLTHANLLSESVVLIRAYQLMESDEVNLVASPMFHIGAIGSIAPLILIGGTRYRNPFYYLNALASKGLCYSPALALWRGAMAFDAQFFHSRLKSCSFQTEPRGCAVRAAHDPISFIQDAQDVFALDPVERC